MQASTLSPPPGGCAGRNIAGPSGPPEYSTSKLERRPPLLQISREGRLLATLAAGCHRSEPMFGRGGQLPGLLCLGFLAFELL